MIFMIIPIILYWLFGLLNYLSRQRSYTETLEFFTVFLIIVYDIKGFKKIVFDFCIDVYVFVILFIFWPVFINRKYNTNED